MKWTYYPPNQFKYAFDSYFTADIIASDIQNASITNVSKSYNFHAEVFPLLCRILLTIAVELIVGILFQMRKKNQILLIGFTNLATQLILNLLLNLINYKYGPHAYLLHYIRMEIVVFIIEGLIYGRFLYHKSTTNNSKTNAWIYALIANLASLFVGIILSLKVPNIF